MLDAQDPLNIKREQQQNHHCYISKEERKTQLTQVFLSWVPCVKLSSFCFKSKFSVRFLKCQSVFIDRLVELTYCTVTT